MIHAVFFALATVVMLAVSKKIFRTFVCPLGLYAIVWGIALVLYLVNPFDYDVPSQKTLMLFWLGYISFCTGCVCVAPLRRRAIPANYGPQEVSGAGLRMTITVLSLLGLSGSLILLAWVIKTFGTSVLLQNPLEIRWFYFSDEAARELLPGKLRSFVFVYFLGCNYAAAVLSSIYITFSKRLSIVALLPFFGALAFDFAYQGRSQIFNMLCIYVLSFAILRRIPEFQISKARMALRRLVRWVLASVAFIAAFQIWLGRRPYEREMRERAFGRIPVPIFVIGGFNYLIGGLGTFNAVANQKQDRLWYGRVTLHGVETNLGMVTNLAFGKRLFTEPPLFVSHYQEERIGVSERLHLNAFHTYLRYGYDDFGVAGVAILPFMFGLLFTHFYEKMRKTRGLTYMGITVMMLNAVMWSTMVWQFTNNYIWVSILILVVAGLILGRSRVTVVGRRGRYLETAVGWVRRRRMGYPASGDHSTVRDGRLDDRVRDSTV